MFQPGYPDNPSLPNPPTPENYAEASRWDETRRRRRMLEGTWRDDLEERLQEHLGSVRRDAWGPLSLALNPFKNICRELSVLYDQTPTVLHDQIADPGIVRALEFGGLWQLMSRIQVYTLGLNECFVRPHVGDDGRFSFRMVTPDFVRAYATQDDPRNPVALLEYRLRRLPTGEMGWTIDHYDISDEENPKYMVHASTDDGKLGEDLSEHYLGGDFRGESYPFRYSSGRPFLPYQLYHSTGGGMRLFEPYDGQELVEASLDLSVLHQMVVHTFRDASWPQRYVVNLEPSGVSIVETVDGARAEVVTDPASLLQLQSPPDGDVVGQPMVGQFKAGGDPGAMEETLANMVARVASDAGVPPSDIQRLGATARSGAAISLTNEGKRTAQRRYANVFRGSDERLVGICAAMSNRARQAGAGQRYVEGGYRVLYHELPLSPDERRARREDVIEMLDAGLISPVAAYIELHPGVTKAQATREIMSIKGGTVIETEADADMLEEVADELAEALPALRAFATDDASREAIEAVEEAISMLRGAMRLNDEGEE